MAMVGGAQRWFMADDVDADGRMDGDGWRMMVYYDK